MTCIFCHIVERKLPTAILYETEEVAVFKEINPDAPVHLLIVPKKHIESVNSLEEETAGIMVKMVLAAKHMAGLYKIQPGYRLVINCGRQAGQVVNHLHMHLLGGWGRSSAKS